ncbi:MAG TPA: phage baseplate assembly protein, partial [Ktedonobacteraceae bacterium]|nr:phage baseplate assembly protein [Ktedonobacteraceae bacterium]
MHRATPNNSSIRSYAAGGSRATNPQVDDSQFMQETMGNGMANEMRKAIEAPQNFGFTSVAKDAISGIQGKIMASAESFMSFMGGNRSFPVMGNMDDRRHRLMNLDKGDSGMFSTQGAKQQFHMSTQDGMFGTAPNDKTLRFALLDEKSEQDMDSQSYQAQQTAQLPGGRAHEAALKALLLGKIKSLLEPLTEPEPGVPTLYDSGGTGGATSGTNAGGSFGGMKMGQKSLKSKNQQAKIFIDATKDATRAAGKIVQLIMAQAGGGGGSGGKSSRAGSSSSGGSSQDQGTVLA